MKMRRLREFGLTLMPYPVGDPSRHSVPSTGTGFHGKNGASEIASLLPPVSVNARSALPPSEPSVPLLPSGSPPSPGSEQPTTSKVIDKPPMQAIAARPFARRRAAYGMRVSFLKARFRRATQV